MILVTGGTGFLGGHLLWHLLQRHTSVVAIRRRSSSMENLKTIFSFYTTQPETYLSRVEWRFADLNDLPSLEKAMEGIQLVYHCGAVVSLGGVDANILETNVIGTRNVVQVALQSPLIQFCFVSSIAACGKGVDNELIDEQTPWNDNTLRSRYSKSKYFAEQEVWHGIEKGLQAVIVNPGVILGPFGSEGGSAQLFLQAQKGMKFYTSGGTAYLDVRDVVEVMLLLVEKKIFAERFILGGENCSHREILNWMADGYGRSRPWIPIGKQLLFSIACINELLAKLLHSKPFIDRGTARSASNRSYYSNQKVEVALGFQFSSIRKCIQEVCAFQTKSQVSKE